MKGNFEEYLNKERGGFHISFEIIACMMLFAAVVFVTIYFTELFETERYFANVTSSTCQMACRYGGNNSKAYAVQVKNGTIEDNANYQLRYIQSQQANSKNKGANLVPINGKYISVSDEPASDGTITVRLSYKLGDHGLSWVLQKFGNGQVNQEFKLPTLMQSGKLTVKS